jgi:glyoxylase-like metal-dependent hydrolase (beta-lactamase superfamily II)
MIKVKYQLLSAGYCEAMQHHALQGAPKHKIKFYATFGYIHHPKHGHILFDTGYTSKFYTETRKFPFNLYAKTTKVYLKPEEEAKAQLMTMGIEPHDVSYIIISHFHADHVCGLLDYPNARFVCSDSAYRDVKNKRGLAAVKRAFIPNLMPVNFEARAQFVNISKAGQSDEHLGKMVDLFEDGSIQLMDLSGHAKGQIGALLETNSGPVLLAADAAWKKENYSNMHLPSKLVKLIFDSWSDYIASLAKVHHYHKAHLDTPIIPCHCSDTLATYHGHIW